MPKPQKSFRRMSMTPEQRRKYRVFPNAELGYIDYKDVDFLRRFMSDRAKIRSRKVTDSTMQQQRTVVRAIKNAREMALLSYNNRITSQRGLRYSGGYRMDDTDYEDEMEAEAYADLTAKGYKNGNYAESHGSRGERGPRDGGSPRDAGGVENNPQLEEAPQSKAPEAPQAPQASEAPEAPAETTETQE